MIKVGILGFGGIAHVHRNGYEALEKNGKIKLVAVCDINPEAFKKDVAINISDDSVKSQLNYNEYTSLDEMLEKEQLDMIDICLPTYLHKNMAVKLLELGYNVMCEKPMAKTYEECVEMLSAAKKSGKQLMIGQCLHFFPEYEFLKETVDSNTYGKPLSAFFQRLSPPPVWGWENWYMDSDKSGGCMQDMHIHDIDMSRYLFGEPDTVSCRSKNGFGNWDMAHSVLSFGNLTATVIGDWSLNGFPFMPSYRVAFEHATVVYEGGLVVVYKDNGEVVRPEIQPRDGYAAEIEYFVDLIENNLENTKNPADSAAESVRLIEKLRESATQNGKMLSFN